MLNRIDIFTDDECKRIEDTVDKLDVLWINRSCTPRFVTENPSINSITQQKSSRRAPFWTLGAVSYLDGVEDYARYHKHKQALNPVLKKKFSWMYQIICDKFSEHMQEEFVVDDVLGLPGFHIFAAKRGQVIEDQYIKMFEQPLGSIHVDIQYREHHNYWQTFNEVDLENTLSFTIPIKLPKNGGGLYTWDIEVDRDVFNYNSNKNKQPDEDPTVNPYHDGQMIYFIGHLLHQMMPGIDVKPDDKRLTVQGHGVKCDGIWRLYF